MNDDTNWNDKTREELRERLRWFIRGELRLMNREADSILEACEEVYIRDDCPEGEVNKFIQFASEEIKRTTKQLIAEQASWPEETDCDRLDRVEAALRKRGILLWQVSPCCDTCTLAEFPGRIDLIEHRHPGIRETLCGYAFFIDQNMPEALSDGTEISVYLGYGWISPDNTEVPPDVYGPNALEIARQVCECLRNEGFESDWNGKLSNKIGLTLNWQRRKMLD